jgi:hypothetical protein
MSFGYIDPTQQAQFPGLPEIPGATGGPLANLPDQMAVVLNSADSHHVYLPGPGGSMLQYPRGRQHSTAEAMAAGAAAGFTASLVWRGMRRRKAVKNEYTTPTARLMALLVMPFVVGMGLSMVWIAETGIFVGTGAVLGPVLFTAYLVYRVTGHGRYNTNRKGSPWRDDHQR